MPNKWQCAHPECVNSVIHSRGAECDVIHPADEVFALRALLRKIQPTVGWWAALSYIDGPHGQKSRWTEEEQALLRRAGLTR